jgi:hypothetical protein
MAQLYFFDSRAYRANYFKLTDLRVEAVRLDEMNRPSLRIYPTSITALSRDIMGVAGVTLSPAGWTVLPDGVTPQELHLDASDHPHFLEVERDVFRDMPAHTGRAAFTLHVSLPDLYATLDLYALAYLAPRFPAGQNLTLEPVLADRSVVPSALSDRVDRRTRNAWTRGADHAANLFQRSAPTPLRSEGHRCLDLGGTPRREPVVLPADLFAPSINYANDETVGNGGSLTEQPPLMLGLSDALDAYEPYRAARPQHAHLDPYFRLDAWTTPWGKVFVHRGADGWRVVASLPTFSRGWYSNVASHSRPRLQYCIPFFYPADAIPETRVTVRGLTGALAEEVARVPGLSVVLMQTLSALRGLIRKRDLSELAALPTPLPKGHFVASLGLRDNWNYSSALTGPLLRQQDESPWYTPAILPRLHQQIGRLCASERVGRNLLVSEAAPTEISPLPVHPVATRQVRLFRRLEAVEAERVLVQAATSAPTARVLDL